jgi:predicted transcriptional regulator
MQAHAEGLYLYREYGLASLVLPGLGHLLQGMPFRALLWFGGAVFLWGVLLMMVASGPSREPLWLIAAPVIAGYHSASMYAAVRARMRQSGDLALTPIASQALPLFLWKQAIGGALAVAGVIVIVLWTGRFADELWGRLHGGWGWVNRGWGEMLSYTLLLWAMTAAGGWLFWQGYKEQKEDAPRQRERALIAQALHNGGVITPAEASLTLNMTLAEARDYLERLAQQGLAQREEQQGLLRYRITPDSHTGAV